MLTGKPKGKMARGKLTSIRKDNIKTNNTSAMGKLLCVQLYQVRVSGWLF
jgi:hypothetical protein